MSSYDQQTVFDATAAETLVKELRVSYNSGKTRSYQWRVAQLKSIVKMSVDHEDEIIDALRQDLSKPEFESYISEVCRSLQLHPLFY